MVTDEGEQLQRGLEHAGWKLCGFGYDDNCTDVPTLIDRHQPSIVFVQDCREWRQECAGCYDPRVEIKNWRCLHNYPDIIKTTVVKDAGSLKEFQRDFFSEIGAAVAVTYYHDYAVLADDCSTWLRGRDRVRTYHSVDADYLRTLKLGGERRRGIVTGCAGPIYPLRQLAFANAERLDIDIQWHPGYAAKGCGTREYLRRLSGYRTHIACSSRFSFSLRKLIESVAVGCVPITDLPTWDVLPEIDPFLIRVPRSIGVDDLRDVITDVERAWTLERAMHYAEKCRAFFDWRAAGLRLSGELEMRGRK
jgi:hypothetical protein